MKLGERCSLVSFEDAQDHASVALLTDCTETKTSKRKISDAHPLTQIRNTRLRGPLRDFKLPRKGDGILCTKHFTRDNDTWYDCEGCLTESQEWAEANGFTQCVYCNRPYLKELTYREGTDKGVWVEMQRKLGRWVNNDGRA